MAAVGGLDAARDGMQGLMDGRFPGKMVIFPQVESFPLTALTDLKTAAQSVFKLLGPIETGRARPRWSFCGCMQRGLRLIRASLRRPPTVETGVWHKPNPSKRVDAGSAVRFNTHLFVPDGDFNHRPECLTSCRPTHQGLLSSLRGR